MTCKIMGTPLSVFIYNIRNKLRIIIIFKLQMFNLNALFYHTPWRRRRRRFPNGFTRYSNAISAD